MLNCTCIVWVSSLSGVLSSVYRPEGCTQCAQCAMCNISLKLTHTSGAGAVCSTHRLAGAAEECTGVWWWWLCVLACRSRGSLSVVTLLVCRSEACRSRADLSTFLAGVGESSIVKRQSAHTQVQFEEIISRSNTTFTFKRFKQLQTDLQFTMYFKPNFLL